MRSPTSRNAEDSPREERGHRGDRRPDFHYGPFREEGSKATLRCIEVVDPAVRTTTTPRAGAISRFCPKAIYARCPAS